MNDSSGNDILGNFLLAIMLVRAPDGSVNVAMEAQNAHLPKEIIITNLKEFVKAMENEFSSNFTYKKV